jgi:hypothetical protein
MLKQQKSPCWRGWCLLSEVGFRVGATLREFVRENQCNAVGKWKGQRVWFTGRERTDFSAVHSSQFRTAALVWPTTRGCLNYRWWWGGREKGVIRVRGEYKTNRLYVRSY